MIVGRERERAAVDAFIATLGDGPRALILEGEPGIGKTTLFRYALDAVRARAVKDVVVDPGEPDAALPFTGLAGSGGAALPILWLRPSGAAGRGGPCRAPP